MDSDNSWDKAAREFILALSLVGEKNIASLQDDDFFSNQLF